MKIVACYKIVPEEQDLIIRPDRTLNWERAEWKIGQYDLCAVEAGMQLSETNGGSLTALSAGTKQLENSKLKKGILSRGPQDLFIIADDALDNADAFQTASTLAAAVNKIGDVDLVLCGEGSSDLYTQQVGVQLGELLGYPVINAVSKITVQDGKLLVERTLEDEVEVLQIPLPAVISVTTDINLPRIPSMKEILAAGKKPVTQWGLADLDLAGKGSATKIDSTLAPEQADRKRILFEGDSEEVIQKLYENLRKEL
ncbi:electron transfer flavoprotein [Dehalobacter sp. DCM]|uniref:electron transfer flavoprotein n=1 Tax=Dehalobacter sp. DCM TaxID=2907827 RepID=UPI0030813C0A|nr:electron transfer flavoprotein [Dehalobacter sp. DCM]